MRSFGELMSFMLSGNWCGQPLHNDDDWKLVQDLFTKHYPNQDGSPDVIPKKVHQIWLGSKIPSKYDRIRSTWQSYHPDWEYKLWVDADVAEFQMRNASIFNRASNLGAKSDIFRYEILYRFGGVYVDIDFECIQSFNDLLYLDFFTGTGYNETPTWFNGLIACTPSHPILESLVNELRCPIGSGWDGMSHNTGPYYFSEIVSRHLRGNEGKRVVFPAAFFYPVSNAIRGMIREDTEQTREYVKQHLLPETKCVHLWYCSWQ